MGLVLFRRPGTVAILDDDEDFLQIVEGALRKRWRTLSFSSAQDLLEHATSEIPFDDADVWMQQEIIARWRSGISSLPAEILAYWARNSERFALTRVAVVDHLVPCQRRFNSDPLDGLIAEVNLTHWAPSIALLGREGRSP